MNRIDAFIDEAERRVTAEELIDELTYSCYRFNREESPNVTPEQWAAIFRNVRAMEARYQRELRDARMEHMEYEHQQDCEREGE